QYITQRTLGSKSLAEGQKGIVFAAFLKLLIPFVVVIPGILAFNLFGDDLRSAATVKNAKTIAEYAPRLYEALSDDVKPDPENPLYGNDLKAIGRSLEGAPQATAAETAVFRFSETFAGSHPADAAAIVEYNRKASGDAATDDATSQTLVEQNEAMLKSIESDSESSAEINELVLRDYDAAFPVLLKNLLPYNRGVLGFVLAAIFGAVVSSLASMLNSASTIASMDLYRKVRSTASQYELVTVGRVCVVLFVLIAMFIAPSLDNPAFGGIFTFIQEFQGFISPGVLAVFIFGLLVHRAPRSCGMVGLILSPVLYGLFKFGPQIPGLGSLEVLQRIARLSFLDRMSVTFLIVMSVLFALRLTRPMPQPVDLPVNENMNVENSKSAMACGAVVICLTIALYVKFW
ncbi:MAG: hypothetical protein AAF961_06525, partial [Planctomycetota bacterium]